MFFSLVGFAVATGLLVTGKISPDQWQQIAEVALAGYMAGNATEHVADAMRSRRRAPPVEKAPEPPPG